MDDEEHLEAGGNMEDKGQLKGIGASKSIIKDAYMSLNQISDKVSPLMSNRSNDLSPIHVYNQQVTVLHELVTLLGVASL